jgi:formylglycine-generating enzyme required for sulfatase activity
VPQILADLAAVREDVLPRLRQRWDSQAEHGQRMRVGLALLPVEPERVLPKLEYWLLHADDPAEVLLVREVLVPHGGTLRESLWQKAGDTQAKPAERFRALIALAAFDAHSELWPEHASLAVEQMLAANPLHLGSWVQALRPVRPALLPPLSDVYRKATSPERREFAATVLADYAADRPGMLTDLLLDADPKQYAILFPALQKYRKEAVALMQREVRGEGYWSDQPLPSNWVEPAAAVRREIEAADGLLAERWALCQTLPLERLQTVTEALRPSGYRPIRVRPYAPGSPRVAVVWTRDGRDWKLETGLSGDAIKERDASLQKDGLIPAEVAGYPTTAGARFAALWVKPLLKDDAARLYVDVPSDDHKAALDVFSNDGFAPWTVQGLLGSEGKTRFCGVWRKANPFTKEGIVNWEDDEDSHRGKMLLAERLLVDLAIAPPPAMGSAKRPSSAVGVLLMQNSPLGLALCRPLIPGPLAFASVWHNSPDQEAVASHGLTIGSHLERCRELASQGYRPATLSVTVLPDGKTVTASAWHRPSPNPERREQLARRQATGAVSLLKLNAPDDAWPLWRHRPDPEARSQLVWRSGLLGLDPNRIVQRLEEETDASARRALILALGEFTGDQLPAAARTGVTQKLLTWYREDPDPGIHAAIDWLLRPGKEGPEPRPLDWGQAEGLRKIDEELASQEYQNGRGWYVNGQGQTMILIPGPVEFRMGSPRSDLERRTDEKPHRRRIPRGFAIASRSVTVGEFVRFLKDRPDVRHVFNNGIIPEPDRPIAGVTWFEAAQYCNWLSEKEGLPESEWCYPKHADIKDGMKSFPDMLRRKGYRLPTEAEWEYAANAGADSSRYYGSSLELLPRYAWFLDNARQRPWPPGQKRPNDLGLFDALGNVYNWVNDPGYYYRAPEETKEINDVIDYGIIADRVTRRHRGRSYSTYADFVRSAHRGFSRPSLNGTTFSLRPARTYDAAAAQVESDDRVRAAAQVEKVRNELKTRNPGYDGKFTPAIEKGAVTGLNFNLNSKVSDLSPVKGVPLKTLDIMFTGVTDLTPLRGMPLETLMAWGWRGSDLTPLTGMPLRWLNCGGGGQKLDLAELAGLPLDFLCVNHTQVSDLGPLRDVPLTRLLCSNTRVTDLAPLRGMRLRELRIVNCKVSNLVPLQRMPLQVLEIQGTSVTDLSPLRGMRLEEIRLTPKNITKGLEILRGMKDLKTIGISEDKAWPAGEFWNLYDKGEFKQ